MKVPLAATTKRGVIEELVAVLGLPPGESQPVLRAVLEREAQESTGIGRGVAIPHGRTSAVKGHLCALGITPGEVEFEAIDGAACRIFFLCVSRPDQPALHVQVLSQMARLLNDDASHAALAGAPSPGAAREVILAQERKREAVSIL